jgi:hypothetical protein
MSASLPQAYFYTVIPSKGASFLSPGEGSKLVPRKMALSLKATAHNGFLATSVDPSAQKPPRDDRLQLLFARESGV